MSSNILIYLINKINIINIINFKAVGYCHLGAVSALPLVSRLVNPLPKSSVWTGHFQGGVQLPPRAVGGDTYIFRGRP